MTTKSEMALTHKELVDDVRKGLREGDNLFGWVFGLVFYYGKGPRESCKITHEALS